ncbi:Nex18 symbiotically induced protein [Meridianimarinicoccus roseus]|uniref:Nex18 symbiotically induced protein n=1 Tax=Meridianimarinicoccus roseus TaxID=2072018 RepID=A0A2V2LEZ4_9RHOB|nr:fasciclin domain-containing protein [Meridianimarinicoccus roseus]PWR01796.1 Nex18 symbiotically induced protein [Meridianimarinicoccus roseus]
MLRTTLAAIATATVLAAPVAAQDMDIVDTAVAADDFNTLVAAVQTAGLVDTLKDDGPFTVFAPTDAAFAALPEGTVESLLLPENRETLTAILTLHVVPDAVMSSALAGETVSVLTVNGERLTVDGRDGVMVNGANVVTADIEATNGVIHVIDAVLLPTE